MNITEIMFQRRSIRKYQEQQIDDTMLEDILACAMAAPSACNKQPWEFYVIKQQSLLQPLRLVSRYANYNAPCIIVVAGNLNRALPLQLADYWIQDCSAAVTHILLRATELGLGTCWCGLLPQKRPVQRVQAILSLPEHIIPLALIHVGYAAEIVEGRTQYQSKHVHFLV